MTGKTETPSVADPLVERFRQHLVTGRNASAYTTRNHLHALGEFSAWHQETAGKPPDWAGLRREDSAVPPAPWAAAGWPVPRSPAVQRPENVLPVPAPGGCRPRDSPCETCPCPKPDRRLPTFIPADRIPGLLEAPLKELAREQASSKTP